MGSSPEFPNLCSAARELGSMADELTMDDLRRLLCHDCDFFTEDHEDELECSCFQILRLVLQRGVLSPAELAEAVKPRGAGQDVDQDDRDDTGSDTGRDTGQDSGDKK